MSSLTPSNRVECLEPSCGAVGRPLARHGAGGYLAAVVTGSGSLVAGAGALGAASGDAQSALLLVACAAGAAAVRALAAPAVACAVCGSERLRALEPWSPRASSAEPAPGRARWRCGSHGEVTRRAGRLPRLRLALPVILAAMALASTAAPGFAVVAGAALLALAEDAARDRRFSCGCAHAAPAWVAAPTDEAPAHAHAHGARA
ncbi:MAG: hypothetical protein QM767_23610 [Anaeromyxobacter sp.]